MEIYNKALEAQKKSEHLQERRQRLSTLLHSEAREYETELAQQKGHQSGYHRIPLEELKSVNYELQRHEEDKQRRERELKLYHQWRTKQPSIREVSVILWSVCCVGTKDCSVIFCWVFNFPAKVFPSQWVTIRTGFCNKLGSITWRHKYVLH
jgi:hypothetical protein